MQKWIMSGLFIIAGAFALVLMFTLPSREQTEEEAKPPQLPEITMNAEQAEALVRANCISCHGDQLQGGAGPALDKIGAQMTEEELYSIISKGKGGMMPAFKDRLQDEEIANVAMWLAEKQ